MTIPETISSTITGMAHSAKFRCLPDVPTVSTVLHRRVWVLLLTITTGTDGSIFLSQTYLMKPMRFIATMAMAHLQMSFTRRISVKRVSYLSDSAQVSLMRTMMAGGTSSSLTDISLTNIEETHDVLTYRQPDQLFRNSGDNTFQEISESAGAYFERPTVSRGALFGDYDNDGDVDLLVTHANGPITLLRNDSTPAHNWIRIKTVGVISSRDGVGTRVTLRAGERTQVQEVNPGASYLSSHGPATPLRFRGKCHC